jgi:ATP-dependent Clp protease protease subunit
MIHEGAPESSTPGSDSLISRAEEEANAQRIMNELFAKSCGKAIDEITRDRNQIKFFSAENAVDYGLIDGVLISNKELPDQLPEK